MLDQVVGQERAKKALNLLTHGYKRRGFIPPIGIFGGSGLGKTHLVTCWCEELGAKQIYINGNAVKDALSFRKFFQEAADDSTNHYVIFVDECHGLPSKVQDNLLSVLEQPSILCTVATKDMGVVRCVDGRRYIEKGDVMREELPKNMTFALATTDPAKLKEPVLNRLRRVDLVPYTIDDKIEVAMKHIVQHGTTASAVIYEALAQRSRSMRHLKSELCETFIDIKTLYRNNDDETLELLDDMLGIDDDGANDMDRDYLEYLLENGVVGLDTMAGRLRVDKRELLTNVEPFLLEKGWMQITGRGRRLTEAGHLKITEDQND